MNSKKVQLLKKAYDEYIKLMLYDFPVDRINEIVVEDVSGFGTTLDEKVLEIKRLKKIVTDQREQGAGIDMQIRIMPVRRRISPDEDNFIYMDEFEISMLVDGTKNVIPVRLTSVFEFRDQVWKLVHLHGSKAVETEDDTWHLNEWKQKNEQLQKLVDDKTAELTKQNRELEIEAALEKVRSSSLAMHKSDELREIVKVVFEKLKELNFAIDGGAFIGTTTENSDHFNYWIADDQTKYVDSFKLPNYDAPTITDVWKAKESGLDFISKTYSFQEKNIWFEYAFKYTELKTALPEAFKKWILDQEYLTQSFAIQKNSMIGLHFHHKRELSENEIDILKRFSRVFEQGYVRFLDLQKAEAQTREAQIEAALERVRSRTMGMQKSDELAELNAIILQQVKILNVPLFAAGIHIADPNRPFTETWIGDPVDGQMPKTIIDHSEDPLCDRMYCGWKEKKDFIIDVMEGDALKVHFQNMAKYIPDQKMFEELVLPERLFFHLAYFSYGFFVFTTVKPCPEDHDIFKRFAKVFEQTYTRFLDLQKAEAQAREAQIEVALERVRARSMGMHKSEELIEVVRLLDKEIKGLGVEVNGSQIVTDFANPEDGLNDWFATEGQDYLEKFHIPYLEHPLTKRVYNALHKSVDFYTENYSKAEKNKYFRLLFKYSDFRKTPQERQEFVYNSPAWIRAAVVSKNSILIFQRYDFKEFTKEEEWIFKRFGKVFEQAYTRFLDLQKAEAQAREAQIEASLERFRSRMLGMHKSSELEETTAVMYQQMNALGILPEGVMVYIVIIDNKTDTAHQWIVSDNSLVIPPEGELRVPLNEHPLLIKTYEAWKRKEPILIRDISGEELEDFKNYFRSLPSFQRVKSEIDQWPDRLVWTEASFSHGTLGLIYVTQLPKPTLEILKRFSRVFDLTYIRFLDIQKAEAQAREAQIEAALERVRSRSLAMHKSDEIEEVAKVVLTKIQELNITNDGEAGIILPKENSRDFTVWLASPEFNFSLFKFNVPYADFAVFNAIWDAKAQGLNFLAKSFSFKEKSEFFDYLHEHSDFKYLPEDRKKYIEEQETYSLSTAWVEKSGIQIPSHTGKLLSEKEGEILIRFAKVFEQSYIRFLDLQKAEAQAHESEIQLALERVRARSLAMHKSDELQEVITVINQQLNEIGIKADAVAIHIPKLEANQAEIWTSTFDYTYSQKVIMPVVPEAGIVAMDYIEAFMSQTDFTKCYSLEEKNRWWNFMFKNSDFGNISEERKRFLLESPVWNVNAAVTKNSALTLSNYNDEKFHETDILIIRRFAHVFEQTYIRFLDLQKAEAQAKEAEIETALEKVRSRSLAMHKSEEIGEVVGTVLEKLQEIGITNDGEATIVELKEGSKDSIHWLASDQNFSTIKFHTPYSGLALDKYLWDQIDKGLHFFTHTFSYEEKNEFQDWAFIHSDWKYLPDERKTWMLEQESQSISLAWTEKSAILIPSFTNKILTEKEGEILIRFSKVFEQAYIRFLDLQKAEAQAREAQIEAALEKVRSRSLAMHTANELSNVVTVIVEKLKDLEVVLDANGAVLCTYFKDSKDVLHWIASPDFSFAGSYLLPYFDHPIFNDAWKSKISGVDYFSKAYPKEEKDSFFEYAFEHSDYRNFPDDFKNWVFQNDKHILSFAWQKNSAILIPSHTGVVPSADDVEILKRFARVFEQAYTRFLDLQKAEAQAREAQIEASLERVRAKAMAMYSTKDISGATAIVFNELTRLGIKMERCGIGIFNETPIMEIWSTPLSPKDKQVIKVITGKINSDIHPMLQKSYQAWKNKNDFFSYELKGSEVEKYYELLEKVSGYNFPKITHYPDSQILNSFHFNEGDIFVYSVDKLSDDTKRIVQRFTKVFSLTYRRYLDIVKAEEQAREAVKQASLDRVRGEIASMRTKDDLNQITPLIWKELTALGVPFIRCGVFIMDETREIIQSYLSTPSGESLTAFELSFDAEGIPDEMAKHWKKNKIYQTSWDKKQFVDFMQNLIAEGKVDNPKSFQGAAAPPESLFLNFVPFKQGMLYVGNTSAIQQDELLLVKSLAESFSIAYARYEDFKNLEEAKLQTEKTLVELKATQAQLIQSEKMASLGELTAGIAHEIQNPLNFVNNFSEVSSELIKEIQEERHKTQDKRDEELENELLSDIEQNLNKINHHGQRASGIVKGMLEHSRTSEGKKEPTDINALADEYLRLAYHGLRAKDKSFNADFKTEFDESLPKINVIPQDIGRVLLNLINNAFYAVQVETQNSTSLQQTPQNQPDYKPTVMVSTKNMGNHVEILVKDNGPGIDKNIVDKIFQPFFTTKPTGQGTGLGLSLSYDIIKAHGGEIIVESEEGNGTRFIIRINSHQNKIV